MIGKKVDINRDVFTDDRPSLSPIQQLRQQLLEAAKKLDDWAYDDTTARECRQFKAAAQLAREAALMIPVDEEKK